MTMIEFVKTLLQKVRENLTPSEWDSLRHELFNEGQVRESKSHSSLDHETNGTGGERGT